MSQEKVNRYKAEKANRKQILKRQKRNRIIGRIAGIVICLAIVGWLGYSVYDSKAKKDASTQTEVDLSAIQDYMAGLSASDTGEDTSGSDTSEPEDTDAADSEDPEDAADSSDTEDSEDGSDSGDTEDPEDAADSSDTEDSEDDSDSNGSGDSDQE